MPSHWLYNTKNRFWSLKTLLENFCFVQMLLPLFFSYSTIFFFCYFLSSYKRHILQNIPHKSITNISKTNTQHLTTLTIWHLYIFQFKPFVYIFTVYLTISCSQMALQTSYFLFLTMNQTEGVYQKKNKILY